MSNSESTEAEAVSSSTKLELSEATSSTPSKSSTSASSSTTKSQDEVLTILKSGASNLSQTATSSTTRKENLLKMLQTLAAMRSHFQQKASQSTLTENPPFDLDLERCPDCNGYIKRKNLEDVKDDAASSESVTDAPSVNKM